MYWWRAGQAALAQSAPVDAVGHLRKALDLLANFSASNEHAALELQIRTALGSALMAGTSSFAAGEAGVMYDRARQLCERLDEAESFVSPDRRQVVILHLTRGEMRAASQLADEALRLAEHGSNGNGRTIAHGLVGASALLCG